MINTRTVLLAVLFVAFCGSFAFAADPAASGTWKTFFPDGLLNAKGEPVGIEQLGNKIVGIYYSAHWCPPCRAFSPKLVEFRNAHKDDFEIVFVSSDKGEKEQFGYMSDLKMEWLTMKYQSPAAEALKTKYNVEGIPTLIILSPKGETISQDGRGDVTNSPDTCLDTWKKAIK
ncbi:MAG: redoxin family protein [Candidatus Riflebacteria bacterium]|nr:redoxin family protein [Candidatus Riflebacteria bacterium]